MFFRWRLLERVKLNLVTSARPPGQLPDCCITSDQSDSQADADIPNQTAANGNMSLKSRSTASDEHCGFQNIRIGMVPKLHRAGKRDGMPHDLCFTYGKKQAGEFLSRVISQMLNHFEDYKDPLNTQIKTGIRPLCQDATAENPAAISDPSRKFIEPEL